MVFEAAAAIGAGIAARSLLLAAFGVDSIIELISASVLYWRLREEALARLPSEESIAAIEQKASRVAGCLLYLLAVYVVLQSLYGLTHKYHTETSYVGIGVALIAAFGMPQLAKAKIQVADTIGSRALRADAMETFTCGYLSWILLGGLLINAVLHWWWLDCMASLALVPLILKEGREAISGECLCHPD